jgi:hypothetical protein
VLRLLRPSSGRAQTELRHAQECLPSAQVKAAAAHVQTLKRNQRKKKLSLTYLVDYVLALITLNIGLSVDYRGIQRFYSDRIMDFSDQTRYSFMTFEIVLRRKEEY